MTQTKTCLHCTGSFEITQADLDFYDKISPTFAGEKFPIPTPTLCPDCRQRRRLSFRNERRLYKRKCDASGKDIISIYSPSPSEGSGAEGTVGRGLGRGYTIYDQKIRWSDDRDPMKYGRDFDFTRSFTEQFGELMRVVPKKSIVSEYNENCDFTSICGYCKHCYMTCASEKSEHCYYGNLIQDSQYIVDCSYIYSSSYLYECINCNNCYNSKYLINCKNSSNSAYSYNLIGCSYCFNCHDLQNQQYCIDNIQFTKEDYIKEISNKKLYNPLEILQNLIRSSFHPVYEGINNENVQGKYINNSKNVIYGYDIEKGEHIYYSQIIVDGENLYDCTNLYIQNELSLEIMSSLTSKFNLFSAFIYNCNNCLYSINLNDCSFCLGCDGLRNKQYCIFNKQYSKEDYEILVGKIIRHMQSPSPSEGSGAEGAVGRGSGGGYERGEFFHPSLSPFGYNETVAQEYYPLSPDVIARNGHGTKGSGNDEAIHNHVNQIATSEDSGFPTSSQGRQRFGYHRSTYIAPTPQVDKVIKGQDVPDVIDDVTDDILKMAVLCEVSNKPFRITPQELAFYRKHHIPLPRKHPDVRHEERMKLRR